MELLSKESYIKEMIPWAKKAEQATGLPYDYIVAQWGWETGWGTNRGSKTLNNHAGIQCYQLKKLQNNMEKVYQH